MLSRQNILRSTFYSILFIAMTSSAPVDLEELIFDPTSYPDIYFEDDYVDPANVYEYADRKMKRQTSNVFRHHQEDLLSQSNLPLSSQKLNELLQILKKPKKSESFTMNGWSASGMPFNVLYTPNTLQQKFLAAVNAMAIKKPAVPMSQPLRRESQSSERKDDKEFMRLSGVKSSNQSRQIRRHYLVIPQLFVSYGWGSVGK